METISCHSNQTSYPIGTKKTNYSFPVPIDAICDIRKETASGEKSFENVDRRRMPAYTISSPMSLRLRRAKNGGNCIEKFLYKIFG